MKSKESPNFLPPKIEGDIYMVSGFQSQEFGLGLGVLLSPEIYAIVNSNRKEAECKSVNVAKLTST